MEKFLYMINPYLKSLNENEVTLLSSNVTACIISKLRLIGRDMSYIMTYRLTGQSAPSLNQIKKEGVLMFQDNPEREEIESAAAIDIYCYCNNGNNTDSKTGKLAVWSGISPIFANLLSYSKDAFVATSYRDNEIVKGNVFTLGIYQSFTADTPVYFTSEMSENHTRYAAFLLPAIIKPTTGYVTFNIYEDTEYTGGTIQTPGNRNRTSSNIAQAIIKLGATGSNKGTLLPFSDVFGTEGTPVALGGGSGAGADSIILDLNKKYLYELTPSETGIVGITAEFAEL